MQCIIAARIDLWISNQIMGCVSLTYTKKDWHKKQIQVQNNDDDNNNNDEC